MGEPNLHRETLADLVASSKHLPGEFAPLVAALIYLRWVDFYESELEAICAFEGKEYQPILPTNFRWRSWHQLRGHRLSDFFGQKYPGNEPDPVNELLPFLESLGSNRPLPLALNLHLVGRSLDKGWYYRGYHVVDDEMHEGDPAFESLLDWLANEPFETPSDRRRLLDNYDAIFERNSNSLANESRTPTPIAKLIAVLAQPTEGDRIYDPAFGMGNFVTSICDLMSGKNSNLRSGTYVPPRISFSGVEINESTYVIGLTRLALAGIEDPHLELGNSLERQPAKPLDKEGFDLVFADPPFGMRVDRDGLDHFPIRSRNATSLFIQHVVGNLRSEGRAIVVVPHGLLFNRGEKNLRQWLIETNKVQAVIDLPSGAFAPLSSVRSALLVLRQDGPTSQIRMVNAAPYFESSSSRNGVQIDAEAINAVVEACYSTEPSENAWNVETEALLEIDYDLTPRRREPSELAGVIDQLKDDAEVVRLDEIAEIAGGRNIRAADLVDSPPRNNPIPYIRIKDVRRGKASRGSSWLSPESSVEINPEWKLRSGDILLSKSGTIGKVGIVQNGALGAIAANGHYVVRIDRDRVDPSFLLAYLDSQACRDWLQERASGSVISHLPIGVIGKLPVALPPLQVQRRIADHYRDHKTDAFLYMTKLLSRAEGDAVAESIQEWVDFAYEIIRPVKGHENAIDADLQSLEKLASRRLPVKKCTECGQPYWLGTVDEETDYSGPPYNYREGYQKQCLSCWLDAGKESKHSPNFQGGGPLVGWSVAIDDAVRGLSGIASIPAGTSMLHLLQGSLTSAHQAEQTIQGHLPDEENARRFTNSLARCLSSISDRLLAKAELRFSSEIARVRRGEEQHILLQVSNAGDLPLRDVQIMTLPSWGKFEFAYLAERSFETVSIHGKAPDDSDKMVIDFHWQAANLAGDKVHGRRQVAFRVSSESKSPRPDRQAPDLRGSPYICGNPVDPTREDVFFGREDLLAQIRRDILDSGNVVLLEGNRRAGKTSVLKHLEGTRLIPGWLGIYCSFQDAVGSQVGVGVPTVEVFRVIAKSIAKAVHKCGFDTPLPNGIILSHEAPPIGIVAACKSAISEDSAFADLQEYVEVILHLLSQHDLGAILMLDEFDKLQEGIDNGITSPQVPENIRFLVQTYPSLSAILTGSKRLKRLREEYWSALFGLGNRVGVTSLSPEAARRLITEPVVDQLSYSDEAVDRTIYLTARQPFLLQCLCNRIFDEAARNGVRAVTQDLVESAATGLVTDNDHFASLWLYARTHRRRFILALCNRESKSRDPLRFGELSELLASHGIEIHDDTLISDLDFLRDLELIDLVNKGGEGRYAITIPLMGRWIEQQQDLDALEKQTQFETEDEHA